MRIFLHRDVPEKSARSPLLQLVIPILLSRTCPLCPVWRTTRPLLGTVARPRVWSRIVTPTNKYMARACRYRPATCKAGLLTIDRIRDPPDPQELKRHANRSSKRSTGERLSSTRSTQCYINALPRIGLPPHADLLIPHLELRF